MNLKFLFALPFLFIVGCSGSKKPFEAPAAAAVSKIHASLYNRPNSDPDIERFEIPNGSHQAVLDWLDDATHDNKPMKWQVLGHLEIANGTNTIDVSLFRTSETAGAFKVGDDYYRGRSDSEIIKTILAAQDALKR